MIGYIALAAAALLLVVLVNYFIGAVKQARRGDALFGQLMPPGTAIPVVTDPDELERLRTSPNPADQQTYVLSRTWTEGKSFVGTYGPEGVSMEETSAKERDQS